MLPPERHKEACKLFYTWLLRLEERNRRNAAEGRQPGQEAQNIKEVTTSEEYYQGRQAQTTRDSLYGCTSSE